jgi:5-methylcytosine-specific restriction endonuclease McrA
LGKNQFCNKQHADRWWNENRRADWDRSDRKCPACAQWFTPRHIGQTYCDAACNNKAMRRRQRQSGTRASDLHRHRARRYGREYEPISPAKVFERDGWTCGICSRKIPKDKKVPHPLAATLDHIIPMSKPGGHHLYINVRAAHFSCNSKRGNRGAAQLLLVG